MSKTEESKSQLSAGPLYEINKLLRKIVADEKITAVQLRHLGGHLDSIVRKDFSAESVSEKEAIKNSMLSSLVSKMKDQRYEGSEERLREIDSGIPNEASRNKANELMGKNSIDLENVVKQIANEKLEAKKRSLHAQGRVGVGAREEVPAGREHLSGMSQFLKTEARSVANSVRGKMGTGGKAMRVTRAGKPVGKGSGRSS